MLLVLVRESEYLSPIASNTRHPTSHGRPPRRRLHPTTLATSNVPPASQLSCLAVTLATLRFAYSCCACFEPLPRRNIGYSSSTAAYNRVAPYDREVAVDENAPPDVHERPAEHSRCPSDVFLSATLLGAHDLGCHYDPACVCCLVPHARKLAVLQLVCEHCVEQLQCIRLHGCEFVPVEINSYIFIGRTRVWPTMPILNVPFRNWCLESRTAVVQTNGRTTDGNPMKMRVQQIQTGPWETKRRVNLENSRALYIK